MERVGQCRSKLRMEARNLADAASHNHSLWGQDVYQIAKTLSNVERGDLEWEIRIAPGARLSKPVFQSLARRHAF